MISLADFEPLSVAKINIFSSATGVLQKDISETKSMPFCLKRSRYKLRCFTAAVSVDSQVLIGLKYLHQPSNFVPDFLTNYLVCLSVKS